MPKKQNGFTLIELLVVISIIGILSSSILVSLGGARAKARDARRQSDIRQISLAMELDYSDDELYSRVSGSSAPSKIPCSTPLDASLCNVPEDGKYFDPAPKDPQEISYSWIDNLNTLTTNCSSQIYCVYTPLEEGGWFAGSQKGTRKLDYNPELPGSPNGGKCPCW